MISAVPKLDRVRQKFIVSWKLIVVAAAASLVMAALAAHFWIGGSQEYKGIIATLDHLFDITLALGLSLVLLTVGHALAKLLKLEFASTAEHVSFSLFLGTGTAGLTVLCLGLLGLLRPWPIATMLGLFIAFTARGLPELYRVIKTGIRSASQTAETKVLSALFLCLAFFLIIRAAMPPHTADELIYHLPVTEHFLHEGKVSADYNNSLGNLPFLVHMIYALCLMAGSDIAARLFSLILAVVSGVALYGFCSRYLTRQAGIVALFGFFAAGMVVEVAVTARIDVSFAGMLFLATYSMVNYCVTNQRGWLWTSAIFSGFSLGIKHSAGLLILLLGVMYLIERLIRKRERLGTVLKLGIIFTSLALTIASPWYLKNYLWFNNPIYPLVTGEVADFGPQGVRYFNLEDEQKLDAYFDLARKEIPEVVNSQEKDLESARLSRPPRHPARLWELFSQPNTYLMAEPYHFPNYLFLIMPCLLFLKANRWVSWLLALGIVFVFTVTWTSWIARYLLPAYPPLTIVSSYTLTTLSERLGRRFPLARKLPAYTVALALTVVIVGSSFSMRQYGPFGYLTGQISRHEFPVSNASPVNFINTQIPADARVMIIGAQMNYGIRRDYLTDETWFTTKWRRLLVRNRTLYEVNEDLRRRGVTHILYAPSLFTLAAQWGIEGSGGMELLNRKDNPANKEALRHGPEYPLLRNWATFKLYKMRHLESVYTDETGYEVLKLREPIPSR